MTDREALRRAVCMNPKDDLLRLVYADWLEEHGDRYDDKSLAEFIRLQVEYGRRVGARTDWTYADMSENWERASSLFRYGDVRDLGDVPGRFYNGHNTFGFNEMSVGISRRGSYPPFDVQIRWHRGFAWELTITVDEFLAYAETLFASNPITAVNLCHVRPAGTAVWRDEILQGGIWYTSSVDHVDAAAYLPAELQPHLSGALYRDRSTVGMDEMYTYPSRLAATADLSEACVEYGRDLNGLPRLERQKWKGYA